MGERPNPGDFFKERNDWESPPEMGASGDQVKLYDGGFRYRGTWDREPEGVCRVRLFHRGNGTPVLVLSELPENASTSITNLVEILAAEAVRRFCPERFEWVEPTIVLEHYPAEHDARGTDRTHADPGPRRLLLPEPAPGVARGAGAGGPGRPRVAPRADRGGRAADRPRRGGRIGAAYPRTSSSSTNLS